MTKTRAAATAAATLTLAAAAVTVTTTSHAEMAPAASSCSQIRGDYPNGVAKNKKAANTVVRQGFERPIVCKRLYLKVYKSLDRDRNRVVCETR